MIVWDADDTPPHYKATARRPKKDSRYAFIVRSMQLYGEFCSSAPWTPLAHSLETMTLQERLRTTRDNSARLAFQGEFEQHAVERLVAAGMHRDLLARPFTPLVAALVADLARRKLDVLQRLLDGVLPGHVRAPPNVRVPALAHLVAPVRTAGHQATWLNEGAEKGEGNLTRHHIGRARKEYPRYFRGLQPLEIALAVLNCDVRELRVLSELHDEAVKDARYPGLRGAELADAIHSAFDLVQVVDDRIAAFWSPARLARAAA